jgi:protein disulfide isomerase
VNGFPSIKLFKNGEYREDYDGGRSVEGFVEYAKTADSLGEKGPSEVTTLTTKDFDEAVGKAGIALVKFYAPWCGHCKAMVPTWEKVAAELKGDGIVVAKVNAIAEGKLQKRFGVNGFPDVRLFKNGRLRAKYKGERKLGPIKTWAREFNKPAVVQYDQVLGKSSLNHAVNFVLFPGPEESPAAAAFSAVAEAHALEARVGFFVANDPVADKVKEGLGVGLSTPSLVRVEEGESIHFDQNMKYIESDIENWVAKYKKPTFYAKVEPGGNFNDVMYADVMAATVHVDPQDSFSDLYINMHREVAKEMRGKFIFGVMDGVKNENLSKQVGISKRHLPQLVVFDGTKLQYYSDPNLGRTKYDIKTFLKSVLDGTARARKPGDNSNDDDAPTPAKPAVPQAGSSGNKGGLYNVGDSTEQMKMHQATIDKTLRKHESMLEALVKTQKTIGDAIGDIKQEMIDLRRDLETIGKTFNGHRL